MNILDALKKKYVKQKGQQMLELGNKKQYNVNIHPKIINKIRKLSAEYSVPQYAIAEHLLEIGCFYTYKILESLKKREILREHIIDRHMLDSGYDDAEDLMRLGEGRYASELFSMAKVVVRDFGVLKRALSEARRKQNFDGVEKSRDQLFNSVVILADWLATHPLEEQDTQEREDD